MEARDGWMEETDGGKRRMEACASKFKGNRFIGQKGQHTPAGIDWSEDIIIIVYTRK